MDVFHGEAQYYSIRDTLRVDIFQIDCFNVNTVIGRWCIAQGFEPRLHYVRRVFQVSVHLIIFKGHLAYHVQQN